MVTNKLNIQFATLHHVDMDPWPVFTFHTVAILGSINFMSSMLLEKIDSNITFSEWFR